MNRAGRPRVFVLAACRHGSSHRRHVGHSTDVPDPLRPWSRPADKLPFSSSHVSESRSQQDTLPLSLSLVDL